MNDGEVRQASDGTWSVVIDYGAVEPIHGIPSKEIAEHIRNQMWLMEQAGIANAMCDPC